MLFAKQTVVILSVLGSVCSLKNSSEFFVQMSISRNSWQDLAPYLRICGVDLLVPQRYKSVFKMVFFKLILRIDMLSSSYETSLNWLPQNTIGYMSTLV